jgi:hypothetical protein
MGQRFVAGDREQSFHCRHVSGSLERFLLVSGERVIRVATKLMTDARRAARSRGKSIASTRWRSLATSPRAR